MVQTIKRQTRATYGCIWLQAEVHDRGLGCGLDCTPALPVTTAPLRLSTFTLIGKVHLYSATIIMALYKYTLPIDVKVVPCIRVALGFCIEQVAAHF